MAVSTELKAYVTCSAVLYLKFVVTTAIQAAKSFEAGSRPPEDKNLPLAKGKREQTYGLAMDVDDPDEELKKAREAEFRWRRIVANDLESIPIALFVFAGGIFADGNDVLYVVALGVYTAVRCLHTYAYANELQPYRTWIWQIGVVYSAPHTQLSPAQPSPAHSTANMVETNVKVYVACTAALYLKFLATVMIQGGKTFRSGGRPPEDNKLNLAKKFKVKQNYGMAVDEKDEKILKAREVEHRWRRIIMNDLESIPLALFVFAGGILANSNEKVHVAAMVLYTVSRFAHTVAYSKSLQPHRALFWFGGVLTTLVGVGNAIAAIL